MVLSIGRNREVMTGPLLQGYAELEHKLQAGHILQAALSVVSYACALICPCTGLQYPGATSLHSLLSPLLLVDRMLQRPQNFLLMELPPFGNIAHCCWLSPPESMQFIRTDTASRCSLEVHILDTRC